MITIEFGLAEKQDLDTNSLFIKFNFGYDDAGRATFNEALERIKKFWHKIYHGPPSHEWEVPYSCFSEIKELYKDMEIKYLNPPPKAKPITDTELLQGLDFNGFMPYDYQLDGIIYGANHKNMLLLDEQGLGKTLQMIKLGEFKKKFRDVKHCLIICCVNSLKWNWMKEVKKFCKEENAMVLGYVPNKKGTYNDLTVKETIEQIKTCPKEFFWIINIERMRISPKQAKEGNSLPDALNKLIEKGELGQVIIDEIHKCLHKDALISTDKGVMSIQDIINSTEVLKVLTLNENTYELEYKDIISKHTNVNTKPIINLTLDNGNEIKCTPDHKIYTLNRGWIEAGNLTDRDEVIYLEN